jgi:hypothetical protein
MWEPDKWLELLSSPLGILAFALFVIFWCTRVVISYVPPQEGKPDGEFVIRHPWQRHLIHFNTAVAVVVFVAALLFTLKPVWSYVTGQTDGVWYGFFGDLDDKNEPIIEPETIKLVFSPVKDNTLTATSDWISHEHGKDVSKHGEYKGYYNGQFIAMSYVTREIDKKRTDTPTGFGSYLIQQDGAHVRIGKMMYSDCKLNAFVCPYVMTDERVSLEAAKTLWPFLLSDRCTPVVATPVKPTTVPACGGQSK